MGYTNVLSLAGRRAADQATGLLLNESPPVEWRTLRECPNLGTGTSWSSSS